jgi:hypothetical protein
MNKKQTKSAVLIGVSTYYVQTCNMSKLQEEKTIMNAELWKASGGINMPRFSLGSGVPTV